MKNELDIIKKKYDNFFRSQGYAQEDCVKISSGIDESVTLIGSGISVLKPYLINQTIPWSGLYIRQKAVRTFALKSILNANEDNKFSSFFNAFCVLVNPDKLVNLIDNLVLFLTSAFNIDNEQIIFRISSSDSDLVDCCQAINYKIALEFDTREKLYYRHKYGLDSDGIFGRNFNFAIQRKESENYKDVGNIILIEKNGKAIAAELAFGLQTLAMALIGLDYSIEATYINDLMRVDSIASRKLADAIVVTSLLESEDIRKCVRRYPIYLYRRYCRAVDYWRESLGYSTFDISTIKKQYLEMENGV